MQKKKICNTNGLQLYSQRHTLHQAMTFTISSHSGVSQHLLIHKYRDRRGGSVDRTFALHAGYRGLIPVTTDLIRYKMQ